MLPPGAVQHTPRRTFPRFTLVLRPDAKMRTNLSRTLRHLAASNVLSLVHRAFNGAEADASAATLSQIGSECDFVGFMRAGDTLSPEALYEFARAIVDRDPRPDVLYCDEDHLAADGRTPCRPIFKPSWSPETLLGYHYTGRLTLASRPLVDEVGGLDRSLGEAAEWDLMLRLSERTSEVVRVPHCLYHNGERHLAFTPTVTIFSAQDILESHLRRTGRHEAQAVQQLKSTFRVIWPVLKHPKVSVIIPTRQQPSTDSTAASRACFDKTDYPTKRLSLSTMAAPIRITLSLYQEWSSSSALSIFPFDQPFNYSIACNLGASCRPR